MDSKLIQKNLKKMDSQRKILLAASIAAAVIAFVMLVLYNFNTAVSVTVSDTNSKFYEGFDYPGWMMIFYGYGFQYIPGTYDFGTNPVLIIGLFLAVFGIIVCSVLYAFGKNKQKAIVEFVCAGCLFVGAIILVCVKQLGLAFAGDSFYSNTLSQAIEEGTYNLGIFPVITCIVLILAAAVKAANGLFLLRQRQYALKYIPELKKDGAFMNGAEAKA